MSFFGQAELESLEARCWSALGEHARAARHARRAADLQDPHFARNVALYTAELAGDLARAGAPDEAAWAGAAYWTSWPRSSPPASARCWRKRPEPSSPTNAPLGSRRS